MQDHDIQRRWDTICSDTNEKMKEHVGPSATPITMSQEIGYGIAWGTGTYVQGADLTWVLTAEHVISDVPKDGKLAHLPRPGGEYNAAFGKSETEKYPVDVGALPILPNEEFLPPSIRIVQATDIAPSFRAVDEELLFWTGFPGYRSERNDPLLRKDLITTAFQQLDICGLPMLTQRIDSNSIQHHSFDSDYHIGVHYPRTATRSRDNREVPLPNAKGMSGSALWDTKRVWAIENDVDWDPSMAEICGVIWAVLSDPEIIIATKIEHARKHMKAVFS